MELCLKLLTIYFQQIVGGKLNSNVGVKPFYYLCYLEFLIIIIFLIEISKKCFLKWNFYCYQVRERPRRRMKILCWPIECGVCQLGFKYNSAFMNRKTQVETSTSFPYNLIKCEETYSDSTFPKAFFPSILHSSQVVFFRVFISNFSKILRVKSLEERTIAQSQPTFLATWASTS